MLTLRGVVAGYGGGDVLQGVDIDVAEGGIACIVGPNGAGKSTVLRTISGLLHPREGEITLTGEPIHRCSPAEILRRGVAQIPQSAALFPNLTVRENVLLGALHRPTRPGSGAQALRPVSPSCSRSSPNDRARRRATCPAASAGWSSSPAA